MGIWCKCTRKWRKKKNIEKSFFDESDTSKHQYSYSEVYLGAEAQVIYPDMGMEFIFSYSVKDGIYVKIKRRQPYRIFFEYTDGAYYIYDDGDREYNSLVDALLKIKKDEKKYHHKEVYKRLEEIMYNFITDAFMILR